MGTERKHTESTCSSHFSVLRGRVLKLKQGNLVPVFSQSPCSGRRPSAVSLRWRKRTWLRAEITPRQRRGAYRVVLCTGPGLQPESFHFLAWLPVPALHTQEQKYTSSTSGTVWMWKRIKRVYFPFFILSVITVFKKERAETIVTGGFHFFFFLNSSNYLPTKAFKSNCTFTDSPTRWI